MASGVIVAVTDVAAATVAMDGAGGDWVGTVDLSFRSASPVIEGPLIVTGCVVRAGGRLITAQCRIHDGHQSEEAVTLAGTAVGTFRRMRRDLALDDNPPGPKSIGVRQDWARDGSGFERPVAEALGLAEMSPGVIELAKSPYVTNSFGTVNGGTIAILVGAGAESAVGPPFLSSDIEIRYIGQAGEGPVRTDTQIVRLGEGHAVVDVTVVDMSNDRLPIAVASVTLTA